MPHQVFAEPIAQYWYNGLCLYVVDRIEQSSLLNNPDPTYPFRGAVNAKDMANPDNHKKRCFIELLNIGEKITWRGKEYVCNNHHYTLHYVFKDKRTSEGRICSANHYTAHYSGVSTQEKIVLHCYADENGKYIYVTCKDAKEDFFTLNNLDRELLLIR